MTAVDLPAADGSWQSLVLREPVSWPTHPQPYRERVAFAAAHVVADPWGDNTPGAPAAVDWDSTLSFRRHLFEHGLGLAEAMDTAQRGMGLDWDATRELVRRSAEQARSVGARIASGAGTDHLPATTEASTEQVVEAYETQLEFVESTGSQAIVMASRHLARVATSADDYVRVYGRLLSQTAEPVILHWLGEAFDPALAGYWGHTDTAAATDVFVALVHEHADRVDGVKVSLLDADHERGLRERLPAGVRMYTGDDFNYPELVKGDGRHHSDALLGIFAAIAPAAGAALEALDAGDEEGYDRALTPTLPLARHVFAAPTFHYKAGIAFLAWVCGRQPGFTMVGGLQSARSVVHLAQAFRLADAAGLLPDPELAAQRMRSLLEVSGFRP